MTLRTLTLASEKYILLYWKEEDSCSIVKATELHEYDELNIGATAVLKKGSKSYQGQIAGIGSKNEMTTLLEQFEDRLFDPDPQSTLSISNTAATVHVEEAGNHSTNDDGSVQPEGKQKELEEFASALNTPTVDDTNTVTHQPKRKKTVTKKATSTASTEPGSIKKKTKRAKLSNNTKTTINEESTCTSKRKRPADKRTNKRSTKAREPLQPTGSILCVTPHSGLVQPSTHEIPLNSNNNNNVVVTCISDQESDVEEIVYCEQHKTSTDVDATASTSVQKTNDLPQADEYNSTFDLSFSPIPEPLPMLNSTFAIQVDGHDDKHESNSSDLDDSFVLKVMLKRLEQNYATMTEDIALLQKENCEIKSKVAMLENVMSKLPGYKYLYNPFDPSSQPFLPYNYPPYIPTMPIPNHQIPHQVSPSPNITPNITPPPSSTTHNDNSTLSSTHNDSSTCSAANEHVGPLPFTSKSPSLPVSEIPMDELVTPETVLLRYHKLRSECKIGTLAVKLAREAYFGSTIMAKCTVAGCRELPGLPVERVSALKEYLFKQFPKYQNNPIGFEPLWSTCVASINQSCKILRKDRKDN